MSQTREGETHGHLYNGLGSARARADSLAVLTDTYVCEAFYELTGEQGTSENHYLFNGVWFMDVRKSDRFATEPG